MTQSGDVTDEEELAFHRSNTVETIKPTGSMVHAAPSSGSIVIRSSTDHISTDDGGVTLSVDEHRFNSMLTLSELDALAELTVNACRVSPVSLPDSDTGGSGVGKADERVLRKSPTPEPNSGDFIGGLLSGRFLVPVAICAFIVIQSRFKITI